MEAYLEALDVGILRAASQGFPKPRDAAHPQGDELNYEKWNAKARNTIFRGLCKDVFNRVRNHKDTHALWSDVYALHERTKSEREERYHLMIKKLNSTRTEYRRINPYRALDPCADQGGATPLRGCSNED